MDKIAHVQVIPKLSGAQIFSLNILKEINTKQKYLLCSSTEVVSDKQRKDFIHEFETAGVTLIWMKNLRRDIGFHDILVLFEFWAIFRKYKFEVVHTNSTKPGIFARIMARLAGVPNVIHTVHGIAFHPSESFLKKKLYYILEIFALQFGNVNVSVNNFYLKFYKPFSWKKSICIPNGLDYKNFPSSVVKKITSDNNIKRVLFVGRLDNQKNPLTAIKAFNCLRHKMGDVFFDIVGDGELKADCERLVESLGLSDRVLFHGWVNEPFKYYSECDVFFCPSLYEAFGFTFAEAAFYSKPIVASDVEGIPEVVIDGRMGFICSPSDYEEQAKCLERILSDSVMAENFGRFGQAYVIEHFPLEKCVESYSELYK